MIKTKTLTFHSAINYGAILQSLALQHVLEKNGFCNEIINYTDNCMNQYNPFNIKGLPPVAKIKKILKLIIFGNILVKRFRIFNNFINKEMKLTRKTNNIEEIKKIISVNDVLITGSDQVWNPEITNGLSDIYTLNFKKNDCKKISYAASVGTNINSDFIEEYRTKLSQLDAISVREETIQNELNTILNKKVEVVLDPTLLIPYSEWDIMTKKYAKREKEKYILAYTMDLNDEYIKIANELSRKTGYKIIFFDYRNIGFKNTLRNAYCDNPYEFINLIKNAEFVVTNSFHGTAFSILYNKKMWVIPHKTKGSRMIDLLKKLDLQDRIVYTLKEFNEKDSLTSIDFSRVNKILEKERNKSIEWLMKSIKG